MKYAHYYLFTIQEWKEQQNTEIVKPCSYALRREYTWQKNDIHGCYSLVNTLPVPWVRVTSQVSRYVVTTLSQKRPSLATIAKWAIDDCF